MSLLDFKVDVSMVNEQSRKLQGEQFVESVSRMIKKLNDNIMATYSLSMLYGINQIPKRRFYDVVNVLTAIGCCRRNQFKIIEWIGSDNIINQFKLLRNTSKLEDCSLSIEGLFDPNQNVSLLSMTNSFVLLLGTLDSDIIDLREAASFLSRGTASYKTILCKLYQIASVFRAVEVFEKTEKVCVFRLLSPFKEALQIKYSNLNHCSYSISFLLNNDDNKIKELVKKRDNDYHKLGDLMKNGISI